MFDTRDAAAKVTEEYPPFPFIGLDGETYELPHPLTLTTDQARRINDGYRNNDDEVVFTELAKLAPDAMTAITALPIGVTGQLMEAWKLQAEVDETGKSRSPSPATNRAARRSKQTSRSAA